MNQNNKKDLTEKEVIVIIGQIERIVEEDKETRNREISEYIIGKREHLEWLKDRKDLSDFLADTREKARRSNLIRTFALAGEITGIGGMGMGVAGIAIAAGSISIIPFIPALMLFSPVLAAGGGGLLLLTIISKVVRNISPDKDVAEFNRLKKNAQILLKEADKNKAKQPSQTKNNELIITEGSWFGVPPPPPPPPPPPKVITVTQTQKKVENNNDNKPKMSLEDELAAKTKEITAKASNAEKKKENTQANSEQKKQNPQPASSNNVMVQIMAKRIKLKQIGIGYKLENQQKEEPLKKVQNDKDKKVETTNDNKETKKNEDFEV
jgi:hypothetical protein